MAGTGTFAAEIVDWARAAGHEVDGLIEMLDPSRVGMSIDGLPVVAAGHGDPGRRAILGLGGDREAHWEILARQGWRAAAVIHPAASLAGDVEVGEGAAIGPLAVIGAATGIGSQTILSRGALVGHHVRIGKFATLNLGVNVGGKSAIGDGAFVGMGATILNDVNIGAGAIVGAGSLVLRDVEPGCRVQGAPAVLVAGAPGD